MPKRRSKRLAIKARKKSKVKSAKKRARSRRKEDRRTSIGEALGVSPMRDREANLAEGHTNRLCSTFEHCEKSGENLLTVTTLLLCTDSTNRAVAR